MVKYNRKILHIFIKKHDKNIYCTNGTGKTIKKMGYEKNNQVPTSSEDTAKQGGKRWSIMKSDLWQPLTPTLWPYSKDKSKATHGSGITTLLHIIIETILTLVFLSFLIIWILTFLTFNPITVCQTMGSLWTPFHLCPCLTRLHCYFCQSSLNVDLQMTLNMFGPNRDHVY